MYNICTRPLKLALLDINPKEGLVYWGIVIAHPRNLSSLGGRD